MHFRGQGQSIKSETYCMLEWAYPPLISHFLLGLYLQNYKEFEAEILDLQSEKYGLSFDIKKYTTSG